MRKDGCGNFIFNGKTTSLQNLIDLCEREFPGIAHDEIFFPVPNSFYPENLEYFEMVIGKRKRDHIDRFLNSEKTNYNIPLGRLITLDFTIKEAQRVPNCNLSKSSIMWHKGDFFLVIDKI